MNLTSHDIDQLSVSLIRECNPPEITRSKIIPSDVYIYKYGALGSTYDFGKYCATLREKTTGRLVGYCGASPVRIQYKFVESVSFWTVDLFVIPEYQGKGLATVLYDHVEKDQPLLLALGTSDRAFPIKIKRGWMASQSIHEYYFRRRSSSLKQLVRQLACNFKRLTSRPVVDTSLEYELTASPVPEKINSLWDRSKSHYPNIATRDFEYVNWRYLRSPAHHSYKFLIAKSATDDIYQAVFVLNICDDRIKIVDYIGPTDNARVKARLIKEIFVRFGNTGLYQCIASCPHLQAALLEAGFYQYHVNPRFTVLNRTGDQIHSADDWFVMLGDSDGEHIEAMQDFYKNTV